MRENFSISTRVSVARAKWRPGHKSQVTRYSTYNKVGGHCGVRYLGLKEVGHQRWGFWIIK